MALPGALANLDHDAILDRISSGTLMPQIAAELGCAKQSLRNRIKNHPRYADAIKDQAEALVEKAIDDLMDDEITPTDGDSASAVIARARARVDSAFKWAAARDPARWGQRTQVDINVDIGTELQQLCRQLNGGTSGGISEQLTIEHESNQDDSDTIR